MKKVYLIANYFHFVSEKESSRFSTLAAMLAREPDIELEVITSVFYQRTKTRRSPEVARGLPYKVTLIEEPGYLKNISLARLHTSRRFAENLLAYIKTQPSPDLIYQSVPTLDAAAMVGAYAEQNGIPFVIDVQDLWPEAFRMALPVPLLGDALFLPYKRLADSAYRHADAVCAVSASYVARAMEKNAKAGSGHPVFIGIDLAAFDRNAAGAQKDPDRVRLTYCGALSKSYDLRLVIDALAGMRMPPQLVVMGDGEKRAEFERYAAEKRVDAHFTGFLPYPEMCRRLCSCDIAVNPIIGTSAASIINKHGDYAASGLPVVNTQHSAEYCRLVEKYRMGFNCLDGRAETLAARLQALTDDPILRTEMGRNARKCAEEKFDRNKTYQELVAVVRGLLKE